MSDDRHSIAEQQELITDPEEKARREVENGVRQAYLAADIMRDHIQDPERPFELSPRYILQLNHAALEGIHPLAGTYRNTPVKIAKSKHTPPDHFLVPELLAQLCDYVNESWETKRAVHLAAYVLWRLNWIHPFADGNGRTARMLMYVVLNIKLDMMLSGSPTIPDQIADDKTPYYAALELADEAWKNNVDVDVSATETLLEGMLAKQLVSVANEASAQDAKGSS